MISHKHVIKLEVPSIKIKKILKVFAFFIHLHHLIPKHIQLIINWRNP